MLFERGVLLVGQMRPLEAIAEFRRVLAINPRNERALYSVAMLLANTGNAAEAAACAERLVQDNPLHLEATYLLAILARETGDADAGAGAAQEDGLPQPGLRPRPLPDGAALPEVRQRAARAALPAQRAADPAATGPPATPSTGVEGMTVGRLRETVLALIPGGAAGGEGW